MKRSRKLDRDKTNNKIKILYKKTLAFANESATHFVSKVKKKS